MSNRSAFRTGFLALVPLTLYPQAPLTWRDPSPHQVQFVMVEEGVQLELLDWGGSGRPVVLLAGSGNTAHVFDDFAPKLTGSCHVFGITRRGFGASSRPASGYGEQRLADDILQILDTVRMEAPVLVGHSMAGGELTILGSQHFDRLRGLVYLDALFDVADYPASDPAYMALFRNLPAPMRTPPQPPSPEESRSFPAYRARQLRNDGFAFPEAEYHNGSETNADGSKGGFKTSPSIFKAIGDGAWKRDYTKIKIPVLSMNETVRAEGDYGDGYQPKNAEERAAAAAFRTATAAFLERWKKNLQGGASSVRFVDFPGAGHYLFLTREAEVLRELRVFLGELR